jgi:hypothetical protein
MAVQSHLLDSSASELIPMIYLDRLLGSALETQLRKLESVNT